MIHLKSSFFVQCTNWFNHLTNCSAGGRTTTRAFWPSPDSQENATQELKNFRAAHSSAKFSLAFSWQTLEHEVRWLSAIWMTCNSNGGSNKTSNNGNNNGMQSQQQQLVSNATVTRHRRLPLPQFIGATQEISHNMERKHKQTKKNMLHK